MILETLFIKSLDSILGGLAQSGFGHLIKVVQDKLKGTDEERRKKAFEKAFDQAKGVINNEELTPILERDDFQAEAAVALLDPVNGFNLQSFLTKLDTYPPEATYTLKRFFDTLQNALLNDETWRPILERYQELQFKKEIIDAIKQNQSELQPREVVRSVSTELEIKDSIVINNMTGNIYQTYFQTQGSAALSEDQFKKILNDYVSWVKKAYSKARLYGLESMQVAEGRPVRDLSDVFIPISFRCFQPIKEDDPVHGNIEKGDSVTQTQTYLKHIERRREEGEEIDIDHILYSEKNMAIIGGAGSGKSTLLIYFALKLVNSILGNTELNSDMPTRARTLVPIIIPLRYYREYKDYSSDASHVKLRHPRTGTLAGFIPWYLKRRSPALELSEDFFDRLLLGGGCFIMIDGLDEVTSREQRGIVRQEIENIANDIYPDNRLIVTARESGFRENAVFGDDFVRFDVQRLSKDQINSIVDKWCNQLYPGDVDKKASELKDSIESINELRTERELPPLISTPLMTTMVISVKWGEAELPRERAKLYEAAVKVILQSQYIDEDEARKDLVEWGGPWEDQREWLSFLAYEMQHGGAAGAAIPEEQVKEILQKLLSPETLKKFIEAVRYRGGLFEERAELFQFVHLTFQEFLAARYIAKERHDIFEKLKDCVQNSWWREALLLTYGVAKFDYPKFAGDYLKWLSCLEGDAETELAGIELAGSALLEIERPDENLKKDQAEKLSGFLFTSQLSVKPSQRVRASDTLARLGDPRPEVMSIEGMHFCYVPEGRFIMGSKKEDDPKAYEEEFLQVVLCLTEYYIGRFPITNQQFNSFVQENGYSNEEYWTKEAWAWKNQKNISSPREYDSPFNLPNHPIVGVSWYEALAFSRWLNKKWREEGVLPNGLKVNLPSEAEWEKASRGGLEIPEKPVILSVNELSKIGSSDTVTNSKQKRIYPWGNEADQNNANYGKTGIGTTSAVGCFTTGKSPYACEEMSGNVWEWTRSVHADYPYIPNDGRENPEASRGDSRVLRGGSFFDACWSVRCAYRSRYYPDFRRNCVGFRVLLSPF